MTTWKSLKKIDLGINTMNDSVSHVFKSEFKQICEHMGSYSPATNSDNLTTLTNYATNNNEKPNNDIIESTITTQNTDVISNNAYTMPAYFDTFPSMLSHWYNVVKGRDETRNKIWRKHLSNSEKKRFQRLARVINAYKKMLVTNVPINEATRMFDEYYHQNKKSLAKLSDNYAKNILDS